MCHFKVKIIFKKSLGKAYQSIVSRKLQFTYLFSPN